MLQTLEYLRLGINDCIGLGYLLELQLFYYRP